MRSITMLLVFGLFERPLRREADNGSRRLGTGKS